MAVDTASKRASASGFMNPYRTRVIPDGTLDQGDRQTVGNTYSGILVSALAAIVLPVKRVARFIARTYAVRFTKE